MKKEKLSENEEWRRLQNRMQMLDLEIPSKPILGNTIPFDIIDAKYFDEETQRICSAINSSHLLTAVPREIRNSEGEVIYSGWQYTEYQKLKFGQFADALVYYDYRIMRAKQIADFYMSKRICWWGRKIKLQKEIAEFMKKRSANRKLSKVAALRESLDKLRNNNNVG